MGNESTNLHGRKQSEHQVAVEVQKILAASLTDHSVEIVKSLLYKIEIDPSGQFSHESDESPMRGQYAFQTDVLISSKGVPLVVIELKSGSFTSHDVITYSFKATRHRQIYPYLRYGFVVIGLNVLGRRFVTHNEGFDFAMAISDRTKIETNLVAVVRRQIASAERIRTLMGSGRVNIRRYEETVEIDR